MLGSLVNSLAIGAGLYSQSPHAEKKKQDIANEAERKSKVTELTNKYKGLENVRSSYNKTREDLTKKYTSEAERWDKYEGTVFNKQRMLSTAKQRYSESIGRIYSDELSNIEERKKIAEELVGLGESSYENVMKRIHLERDSAIQRQNIALRDTSFFNSRGLEETAKAMEEKRMQNKQNAVKERREAIEKNIFKILYKQED